MRNTNQQPTTTLERSDTGWKGFFNSLLMTHTERVNKHNRSITEYKPCYPVALFDASVGVYNGLFSGGSSVVRNEVVCAEIECALANQMPVIVLHEGNRELEYSLRNHFGSSGRYVEINASNPCFEPMYGLNELEVSNLVLESTTKQFDLKYNAKYYIDGVSSLMKRMGKNLSFKMFATCPHAIIFDKVDDAQNQGLLTDPQAQEIRSKLMMGQSENYKLESYFANLQMEMQPILYGNVRGLRPCNVLSAIRNNQLLALDITSVTNTLLMNVIIYQMRLSVMRGKQFKLVIDSIPTGSNEKYLDFLKAGSDKISKTISSPDFYAMVGGDEKLFSSLVGNSQIVVMMQHPSGNSATKWAEVLGQYDAFIESYSKTSGASQASPTSFMMNYNTSSSVSVSKNREFIVKPEYIARMAPSEAFMLSSVLGELAHLYLVV